DMFDLRLAGRMLLRDWAYTVQAVAMLALAFALNTTVFAIVTAMFFSGYPHVERSDRIVYVQEVAPSGLRGVSFPNSEEWSAHTPGFETMALLLSGSRVPLRTADGRSTDLEVYKITANAFGLLGVVPSLGRDFLPADALPGAPPVAILNYRYWDS